MKAIIIIICVTLCITAAAKILKLDFEFQVFFSVSSSSTTERSYSNVSSTTT